MTSKPTPTNDDGAAPRKPRSAATPADIAAPRLTPQGRDAPDGSGEDATDPAGGAKQGQADKAEG
ncbi:hypothetical protein [Methylobacterium oryzihabitans]|uniref:Uncharacterized protein n=1 Tax=Methylobacterium oryzihabitans TaxID=2499852 RepID=A0A437PD41_9HYPH|nr:hypothetical protein [Methylobacterium oryzihabitans]RVU20155.1 hypothetical protein EOE48_05975 [Methylobacterium oryzihabitans]